MNPWYWFDLPASKAGNLKSNEFGVFVVKGHVPAMSDVNQTHFKKRCLELMMEVKDAVGLPRLDVNWLPSPEVWFHSIDIGSCALCRSASYPDGLHGYDRNAHVAYFSHNCDGMSQRGVLLTLFSQWACLVDAYKGLRESS